MKLFATISALFIEVASANNLFVIEESKLSTLIDDTPSLASTAETTGTTADIVSLGSVTRMDYLTAQIETWASHRAVRHVWGFTELQDFDPECSTMSDEARLAAIDKCEASELFSDPKIKSFSSEYYGLSEGNRIRSNDAGWICAQRRVGRAFGWLHSQYSSGKTSIPDFVMVVDDDTYIDLVDVIGHLEEENNKLGNGAFAKAGCLFEQNEM